MRTRLLLVLVLGVAMALDSRGQRADAKGNGIWVLTGGELGDYAMSVSLDLVESPVGTQVDPPESLPPTYYDLLGSWGNFAIPYQLVHGPWVRYYPDAGLLRLQGTDARDHWFLPSPTKTTDLQHAIRDALTAKDAGQLERNPVAVDFRARSLDKVSYRLERLSDGHASLNDAGADDGTMQISGSVSEEFVMHALVDTVSRMPLGSTPDPPVYEISYAGFTSPGVGIGGLLGHYTPPGDGHGGRFWDDGYQSDKSTPYYETTSTFDAIISAALHRSDAQVVATGDGRRPERSAAIAIAFGLGFVIVLGVVNLANSRRVR